MQGMKKALKITAQERDLIAVWHGKGTSIYQYIYAPQNQDRQLWENLPRKQNKRLVFGHWEGDSLEGRRIDKEVLS